MAVFQNFSKPNERAGLALIATVGMASAVSTFSLLIYILWYTALTPNKNSPLAKGVRGFIGSSLGCYLVSLLFCDFIQGSAFMINYHWAKEGNMTEGVVCTLQGAISEVGDLGAALWSSAISFHTFWLLFVVRKPPTLAAPIVLLVGWSTLIILPIVGSKSIQTQEKGSFYGLSGAWCWIGVGYGTERLLYLYVWVFTALGSSMIIYTLIYLRFANVITISEHGRLTLNLGNQVQNTRASNRKSRSGPTTTRHPRSSLGAAGCFDWAKDTKDGIVSNGSGSTSDPAMQGTNTPISKHLKQVARRLMWYPILYAFVVLPVSVCRMGVLAGWNPPFGLLVFAGICFSGSGVTNTILFIMTRHSLIRQVAKSRTRVLVTTQRVTVREESTGSMELGHIHFSNGPAGPSTPKSPFYDIMEHETKQDEYTVSIPGLQTESAVEEEKPSIHLTVLGK